MMTSGVPQVEVGAVLAAWDQVALLRSGDDQSAWPVLSKRIAAATTVYGGHELLRGTVVLIGRALKQLGADRVDRDRLPGALMDRLSEIVEPADLPMVRRVVTVALQGRSPLAWRDRAGPVTAGEPRAMTSALVLIAELVDRVDGPGTCAPTARRARRSPRMTSPPFGDAQFPCGTELFRGNGATSTP